MDGGEPHDMVATSTSTASLPATVVVRPVFIHSLIDSRTSEIGSAYIGQMSMMSSFLYKLQAPKTCEVTC